MKITGTTAVEIKSPIITDLKGGERRCAECHWPFDENDAVIVFGDSIYKEDSVEIPDTVYLLHVSRKDKPGSCIEEFIARFLQTKEVVEPEKSVESIEPTKSAESPATAS